MSREHYLRLCISVFCFFAARIFALTSAQCYASITFGRPLTDNWFECFHSSSTAPCRVASTNLLKVARCWQRNMLLMYSRSTELFFGDKSRIALCYLTLTVVRLMLRLLHLRRFLFSNTTRLRPALGFRMNKRVKVKQLRQGTFFSELTKWAVVGYNEAWKCLNNWTSRDTLVFETEKFLQW